MIYNRTTTTPMTFFLLNSSLLEILDFGCSVGAVCTVATRNTSPWMDYFYFLYFLGLFISIIPLGHYVVAKVEYNWYLCVTNIFPL
jgi:hypothetical protein